MADEPKDKETVRTPEFGEIGKTGLLQYGGFVVEEFLAELRGAKWRRVVKEMRSNDPTIKAMFFTVQMLCRQVTFKVKPADDSNEAAEVRDFIEGALNDMSQSFTETRSEILEFVPWGWSWMEKCFKRRLGEQRNDALSSKFNDGQIGWEKWAPRAQDTLFKWQFDDTGGVIAMEQLAPPDFRHAIIPLEKSLHFRTSTIKGNPEGESMLRSVYRSWYFKQNIENIEGIGIERDLAGLPMLYIPEVYMSADATEPQKKIFEYCKKMVTRIKQNEQAGCILPSDVDEETKVKKFELELLSTGGTRQFDTNKTILRYDQRILMTMMADFLMLGHDKVGSFALASSKTELFAVAVGAFLDSMCDVIERGAFRQLVRLNGWPTELTPKLEHGDIESVDLTELGAYVLNLSRAGIEFDAEEVAWLKEAGSIPVVRQSDGTAPPLPEKVEPPPMVPGAVPGGVAPGTPAATPEEAIAKSEEVAEEGKKQPPNVKQKSGA